jgi:hypothetical protein
MVIILIIKSVIERKILSIFCWTKFLCKNLSENVSTEN